MKYDAILITGPTASGKSALALKFAAETGGAVINADSMQVYEGLRVLSARPSPEEMAGLPHLLYGHVPSSTAYSTGAWIRDIAAVLETERAKGRTPVIVGGTGLYFKALTGGLSDMPVVSDDIRFRLRQRLEQEGPDALHAELQKLDPVTASRLKPADGQRIVRALEIFEATGEPLSRFQAKAGPALVDPQRTKNIVVLPDRAVLADRINRRFASMFEAGAVEEVEALLAQGLSTELPVMRAIGVPEIAAYLRSELSREAVIDRASAATRQYAKRQMTWFRNQMDQSWERMER
jgi:tRNA dimethylallyltransferase